MRILTFDVEEWFHILDNDSTKTDVQWNRFESRIERNMDRIFGLLQDRNQSATFFCLGWIAEHHPQIIKYIDKMGYEIATHSYNHQLAFEQSRKAFHDDLYRSVNTIEDLTGKKVRAYRAPGFSLMQNNKWVFEILAENGIEIDCSIFPAKRAHGGFESFGASRPLLVKTNDALIKEFPINVYAYLGRKFIFTGGGYFRLLPYFFIRKMINNSSYVMTYFHPRDFDPGQPVIKELSALRKFKSYYGIASALNKLNRLLDDYKFVDLKTADSSVNWEKSDVINI